MKTPYRKLYGVCDSMINVVPSITIEVETTL